MLISCGVAPSIVQEQARANDQGDLLTWIFQHDFAYWAITKVFKDQFLKIMGGTASVINELESNQLKIVEEIVDSMHPVSMRSAGVMFDNSTALTGFETGAITAPTLIFHATDDTLQLFHNAEFAAENIPQSTLYRFDKGGHLLLAIEQAFLKETIGDFIAVNTVQALTPASSILDSR